MSECILFAVRDKWKENDYSEFPVTRTWQEPYLFSWETCHKEMNYIELLMINRNLKDPYLRQ